MDRCECASAGFCEFYKQEMTYDPPNWQWCRDASPEDRIKYKISCDKKHNRVSEFNGSEYIKNSDLIEHCRELLLPQIASLNLKGVLGIPRSGMFPASMIALWLNLPLYTMVDGDLKIMSSYSKYGGMRMQNHEDTGGKLLVVDDTIYAGTAINNIKEKIKEDAFYAVVYAHPDSTQIVDFYARTLTPPHFLEWNLFNCAYIERAILDFDGIFCPNVPYSKCKNEELYIDYITNVEPIPHRIPKTFCHGIVTARLEKYRDVTEAWLKKHNINYGFLKMFPTEREEERDKNHIQEAAKFKASHFQNAYDAWFFIESEPPEAQIIRQITNKYVICPRE